MTFLKDWQYALVNVYITMENHHFQWVNPLFLWPFSIATLNYQRVDYRNDGLLYDQSGPNHTGGRICRMNIHCWSCTFTRVTGNQDVPGTRLLMNISSYPLAMALSESNVKLEGFDKFADFECLGEAWRAAVSICQQSLQIAEDLLTFPLRIEIRNIIVI